MDDGAYGDPTHDLSPSGPAYFGFYVGAGYDSAGQWHGPLVPHFEK